MQNKAKKFIHIAVGLALVLVCVCAIGCSLSILQVNGLAHADSVKDAPNADLVELSFNSNGGSPVNAILASAGAAITAPTAPTRQGYVFVNWSIDSQEFKFTVMPAADTVLTAIWEANTDTPYFVAFYKQNIGSDTYSEVLADRLSLSGATDSLIDYRLVGTKYKNFRINNALTSKDLRINGDGNTVFKVYYSNKIYTATFDAAGGECDIAELKVSYGETFVFPEPKKVGNTFGGWLVNDKPIISPIYNFSANTTFTASWIALPFTISFDTEGGSAVSSIKVNFGEPVVAPETQPERKNYKFNGWYLDESCTQKVDFEKQVFTADTVLYAGWASDTAYIWGIVFIIIVLVSFVSVVVALVVNKN